MSGTRARWAALLGLLAASACFLGSDPFVTPAPSERAQLEARVSNDSTDVEAVVALAVLGLGEGSVEEVRNVLERAMALVPGDPALPLLFAMASEQADRPLEARDGYESYLRGHGGGLAALARARLEGVRVEALREEARRLRDDPEAGAESVDGRTVVVLPFAHAPESEQDEATGAAIAALIADDLRRERWNVLDDQRVRILAETLTSDPATYADLAVGVRVGSLLGASRVVQASPDASIPDTLVWNVTVTTIGGGGGLEVGALSIMGATFDLLEMERRLAVMVLDLLDGSLRGERFGPLHTELNAALFAYGRGLRAMDRGDAAAARAAFAEATDIDPAFLEPRPLTIRAAAGLEAMATVLSDAVTDVARVGELQRSVQALRASAASAHQQALSGVGARERALLSDALGLDRLGGATLLELRFLPPSGGAP